MAFGHSGGSLKKELTMSEKIEITPETSVREINLKHPQCAHVFEEMGMGGCGGTYGPNEPLWLFAEAHRVNLDELIAKLKDAIADPRKYEKTDSRGKEDTRYFVPFVKSAILIGIFLGVAFGLYSLIVIGVLKDYKGPSYSAIQAHGHAQFFGWVGLMIIGISAFVLPRFKNVKFRYAPALYVVLAAIVFSLIAQAIARPYANAGFNAEIVFATAVLELFALVVYAVIVGLIYRDAGFKLEVYDLFIAVGVTWFLIAGILHLIIAGTILKTRIGEIDSAINLAYLGALAYGLSGNMIFGVAIRALPSLMGLKQSLSAKWFLWGFALLNLGLILKVVSPTHHPLALLGSGLMFIAGVLVIFALRVFESFRKSLPLPGTHNSYRLLIFYSSAFFIIATGMLAGGDAYTAFSGNPLPHEFAGAFRHAITVGFITAMILGVGYRILPVFAGSAIPNFALQVISVWLLMIGNLWRVGFELLTLTSDPTLRALAFRLMPISGVLELIAIAIFGFLIWATVSRSEAEVFQGEIKPSTRVVDILDTFPWSREVLVSAGLTQLSVIHRPPPFVTLKTAAMMHGVNVDDVVSALIRAKAGRAEVTVPNRSSTIASAQS